MVYISHNSFRMSTDLRDFIRNSENSCNPLQIQDLRRCFFASGRQIFWPLQPAPAQHAPAGDRHGLEPLLGEPTVNLLTVDAE